MNVAMGRLAYIRLNLCCPPEKAGRAQGVVVVPVVVLVAVASMDRRRRREVRLELLEPVEGRHGGGVFSTTYVRTLLTWHTQCHSCGGGSVG